MNFSKLLDDTIGSINVLPWQEIELPSNFSHIQRPEKEGELSLTNRFLDISDLGQLRAVLIASSKINIITVFFFPLPQCQLPVYAMEFVVLGKRPVVAVIDSVCLIDEMACAIPVQKMLIDVHVEFNQLEQAEDPPEWFQACRSGADFFIRPKDLMELQVLAEAHLSVWHGVVNLLDQPQFFNEREAHAHNLHIQEYKDHHRINSPGYRLMNRSFGEAWTEEYLTSYLFK